MPYEWLVPPAADALGCPAADLGGPREDPALLMSAVWIADTTCIAKEFHDDAGRMISYEELRANPESTICRAASGLAGFDYEKAASSFASPSFTASPRFSQWAQSKPPAHSIASPVVHRIQGLLRDFGIVAYEMDKTMPTGPLVGSSTT